MERKSFLKIKPAQCIPLHANDDMGGNAAHDFTGLQINLEERNYLLHLWNPAQGLPPDLEWSIRIEFWWKSKRDAEYWQLRFRSVGKSGLWPEKQS